MRYLKRINEMSNDFDEITYEDLVELFFVDFTDDFEISQFPVRNRPNKNRVLDIIIRIKGSYSFDLGIFNDKIEHLKEYIGNNYKLSYLPDEFYGVAQVFNDIDNIKWSVKGIKIIIEKIK